MVVQGRGDVDVEVGVDTSGDPEWQGGHRHPFVGKRVGWHHTCRDDGQDSDGPLRQAPSRSLRPTGGCRVAARTRPTDRLEDNPVKERQPVELGQTWFEQPPERWPSPPPKWWIVQRPTSSSLPARGRNQTRALISPASPTPAASTHATCSRRSAEDAGGRCPALSDDPGNRFGDKWSSEVVATGPRWGGIVWR